VVARRAAIWGTKLSAEILHKFEDNLPAEDIAFLRSTIWALPADSPLGHLSFPVRFLKSLAVGARHDIGKNMSDAEAYRYLFDRYSAVATRTVPGFVALEFPTKMLQFPSFPPVEVAERQFSREFQVREEVVGPESPELLSTINSLLQLWKMWHDEDEDSNAALKKAAPYIDRVVAIVSKINLKEHAEKVVISYLAIAGLYEAHSKFPEALQFLELALPLCDGQPPRLRAAVQDRKAGVLQKQGNECLLELSK
jgi:hypothetical protein